jgi:3-keto-disaccharide hydrolase
MRILSRTAVLAVMFLGIAGAAESGWQTIFDGRTFAHWENPAKKSPAGDSFVIEDGCLKAVAHPRITEDLFSTDTYRDFELEFDWKISPGGNTGIKYRIQDRVFLLDQQLPRFEDQVNAALKSRRSDRPSRGQEYVIGFEYQLIDNQRNPDALRGGALHQAGALYDMFSPLKDATRPVGEFNHSRLVVKGDHVEHWLNGVKVVDASLKAPEIARACAKRWGVDSPVYNLLVNQPRKACQISLQNHDSDAWFKNIRIRRLD